jgi:hypothetical protein
MKHTNSNQKTFITPEGVVTMSNIYIDPKKNTFSAEVSVKVDKKKAVSQVITGKISQELKGWLINKDKAISIEVEDINSETGTSWLKTGEFTTGFRKYLAKIDMEFVPGILSTIIFKSDNNSPDYLQNPFRICLMEDYAVMTLVNVPPKARKVYEDPNTGKEDVRYSQKIGTLNTERGAVKIKAFIKKAEYRRFVYQEMAVVTA